MQLVDFINRYIKACDENRSLKKRVCLRRSMIWTLESSYVLQTLQQRIQVNCHKQRYNLELLNVKHRLLNLSM